MERLPNIVYGDSMWVDVPGSIAKINSTWPGTWAGAWKISATQNGTSLVGGTLIPSDTDGKFRLELTPDSSTDIPAGDYYVTIVVTNSDAKFQNTQERKLRVTI